MLTAKDSVPDIVLGLDLGGDDYMTKPFSFGELLARLRTLKRRVLASEETKLRVGDLVLDPASREVSRGHVSISLTRTEYNLLERLVYRAGRVVSRRLLIESVWGFDREIEENTLDAFMRLLQNKGRLLGQSQTHPYGSGRWLRDSRADSHEKTFYWSAFTLFCLPIFALAPTRVRQG
jgi:DNA-binding response OmpR family regulator